MKKKFASFFQIFLMLILCITFSACMGMDPNTEFDDEGDEPGLTQPVDDFENTVGGISLDGVKVLRKPSTYDFEVNTPENEGQTDYYKHFSLYVLTHLFEVYGNFNTGYLTKYSNILEQINSVANNDNVNILISEFDKKQDKFLYFYDAIRYQIVKVTPYPTENPTDYSVEADTSKGWKWSLSYNNADYRAFVYSHNGDMHVGSNIMDNTFRVNQFNYTYFNRYYSGENIPGELFEGEMSSLDTEVFSSAFINEDYINALTYAIYSLVLGVEPNEIRIDIKGDTPRAFVEGFNDEGSGDTYKSSAQLALENVKATFTRLGSYVGLTARDKDKIIDYILNNIIGANALNHSTEYFNYYYEDVVEAIVTYCGTITTIGKTPDAEESENTTIGDSFIASEVVDFPYTSFFSSMEDDPFEFVKGPYEYQSFVLMPSRDSVKITDIWLDFKYDAGLDGDDIVTDKSLEIEVSVRWNKGDGNPIREVKQTIIVKDGPADVGEDGTTLQFELDTAEGFGEVVEIGKFKEPDALKPKGEDEEGRKNRVVPITGFTDARKYYKVLESARYGGYGVLNENMIEGSYLEVAFNVNKAPGDTTTNYAFFAAISNLVEPLEYANDPEWK